MILHFEITELPLRTVFPQVNTMALIKFFMIWVGVAFKFKK